MKDKIFIFAPWIRGQDKISMPTYYVVDGSLCLFSTLMSALTNILTANYASLHLSRIGRGGGGEDKVNAVFNGEVKEPVVECGAITLIVTESITTTDLQPRSQPGRERMV